MNQQEWEASVAWSKVVAGSVIQNEAGEYLLVQEKLPKAYGLWNIPAGYVDKGESIEHAAVREAKEEAGYDVELLGKIDVYHDAIESPIKHAFRARIVGGELRIQPDEILDAKWFSFDAITAMNQAGQIRASWIYDAISQIENS